MESLMCCVPHYVRCIKPNERKRALDFDEERFFLIFIFGRKYL